MKKIALNIIALGALVLGVSSCDQKSEPIDNMVFIGEAVSSPDAEIVLGQTGEVSTTAVSISMAQKATEDTKVTLALSQDVLDGYNKRHSTEYAIIPTEYVEFPTEVVIPEGASSTSIQVKVTSFDGEKGVEYAAPIMIAKAEGEQVSQGSSSFVITFGKFLTQAAPGFISSNAMKVPWPEQVDLDNLTLEWWARVTNTAGNGGFSINNQAMFSFEANKEIYVRYGDLTYGSGKYNFLQIKTLGIDANYDSGDPAENPLKWGEWIHWAHTYDSAAGECVLYQNGVEVCRVTAPSTTFNITGLSMCSAGSYHRDVIEMAQVRLWKTTRTAAQIAKNYKKEVKYTDPNLVFYFPMNEGSGSVLHDVTGNGHDITIGSNDNGGNSEAKSWNTYTFQ